MSNPGGVIDYIDHRGFFYRVEGILALKKRRHKRMYLVQWVGGSRTWEPRKTLCQDMPVLVRRVDAKASAPSVSDSYDFEFEYPLRPGASSTPPWRLRNVGPLRGGIKK